MGLYARRFALINSVAQSMGPKMPNGVRQLGMPGLQLNSAQVSGRR